MNRKQKRDELKRKRELFAKQRKEKKMDPIQNETKVIITTPPTPTPTETKCDEPKKEETAVKKTWKERFMGALDTTTRFVREAVDVVKTAYCAVDKKVKEQATAHPNITKAVKVAGVSLAAGTVLAIIGHSALVGYGIFIAATVFHAFEGNKEAQFAGACVVGCALMQWSLAFWAAQFMAVAYAASFAVDQVVRILS